MPDYFSTVALCLHRKYLTILSAIVQVQFKYESEFFQLTVIEVEKNIDEVGL